MSNSPEALLEYRQQPLLELVHSEENYVQQLQLVRDTYMTVVNTETLLSPTPCLVRSKSCRSDRSTVKHLSPSSPLPSSPSPLPPQPPTELATRWRVIWGNWLQLTEWHSQFVEKLKRAVHEQPENVPRLFLNSQARLRSMYMKYCENYSKAVVLVAPFKAYFEELRRLFFDKNDILSRLMQPIQRVTRYQLPMMEALKLTEQAGARESGVWRAAVSVLKNLPNDVQLMLEAARIAGFPGSVTSQGNLRLFGAMYVARTTQTDLRTAQGVARQVSAKSGLQSYSQDSSLLVVKRRAMTSPSFMRINSDHKNAECNYCRMLIKRCSAAQKSINLHFTECRVFLFDQCLIITEDNKSSTNSNNPPDASGVGNSFQANFGRVVYGSGSLFHRTRIQCFDLKPQRPQRLQSDDNGHSLLLPSVRSPTIRRTVQIRRHGSHLSSLESDNSNTSGSTWPKLGWSTTPDPFRQTSYKFLHAVKVNRMAFAPYWLSSDVKHLDSSDNDSKLSQKSSSNSDTNAAISTSNADVHSSPSQKDVVGTCTAPKPVRCHVPDRLWFAVADESPSSEAVFILDPGVEAVRDAWLREFSDIGAMQAQLQLALQNPRRFHFVCSVCRQNKTLSSTDMTSLSGEWRGGPRNAFFSAHSSTTQLVDKTGNDNVTENKNVPLHFRGLSAPQTDWWKQLSDNLSLKEWAEEEFSSERFRPLHVFTSVSHESSVPDIIQTPDDVFLPNVDLAQIKHEDSHHLQLPIELQRTHSRRRSLSQSDAEHSTDRTQLSLTLPLPISTHLPVIIPEQPPFYATITSVIAEGSSSQKKKLITAISSRLRQSVQSNSGKLSSEESSKDISAGRTIVDQTNSRRRLFRWSIVDKGTTNEIPKLSPQLQQVRSSPLPPQPLLTKTEDLACESPKLRQRLETSTPQLLRRTFVATKAETDSISCHKPPSSSRLLSRFRFSFRISSVGGSPATSSSSKCEIPKPPTAPSTATVTANNLSNTLIPDVI